MDIAAMMSSTERTNTQYQVDAFNAALGAVGGGNSLGKDDFLKILLTQLSHQDPTAPMEDREFISQMAQFSSLEQITNMNQQFGAMAGLMKSSQAVSLLGRTVEIEKAGQIITGTVEEIAGRDFPQILVNGTYYDFSEVIKVR